MPANTAPIFGLTPNLTHATLAAANTARDGSGTLVTLYTVGANGGRVDRITWTSAQATAAANSAMVFRVFVTDNAGANPRLLREVAVTAVTASNTAIGATQVITFLGGLILQTGQIIKVTQSIYAGVQDQSHVFAEGIDY